jgi:hypothetical protein
MQLKKKPRTPLEFVMIIHTKLITVERTYEILRVQNHADRKQG